MNHLARALAALLPFVALSACAGAHKPLVAADHGGNTWREVTSAHFHLQTDLDEDDARRVSAALEQSFAGLSEVGFASDAKPDLHIDVVHFARRDDYAKVGPALSGAAYVGSGRHDFEHRPLMLLGGDFTQVVRHSVQHELTHSLMRFYYPQAPTWLNEGFAEYLETFEVEDGHATLGKPHPFVLFTKGPFHAKSDPRGAIVFLPVSDASSVAELVHMTPETFYARRAPQESRGQVWDAHRVSMDHYESAWALVHMLMDAPAYRPAFDDYLKKLRNGEANAWESTLGLVPEAQLEADFRASLAPRETATLRTAYAPPPLTAPTATPMDPARVHVLFARLRDWSKAEERAASAADLEAARSAQPVDVERSFVEAALSLADGNRAHAVEVLRDATQVMPRDPRTWSALGWVMFGPQMKRDEMAPVIEKLRPIATSASQLDLLATVSAFSEDYDAALAYEKRAMAVDPNCVHCLLLAAQAQAAKGQREEGIATATFAMNIAAEGADVSAAEEVLHRLRDRARAGGGARTCKGLRASVIDALLMMEPARPNAEALTMDGALAELDAAKLTGMSAVLHRYAEDAKAANDAAMQADRAEAAKVAEGVAQKCHAEPIALGPTSPLTKHAVNAALGPIAQRCVANIGHSVEGLVLLELIIEKDGSFTLARAVKNETGDAAFAECVSTSFASMKIASPPNLTALFTPLRMQAPKE